MAVVLITGCRSGIGLATALAFGRRGDRVYATMRDPARGERLSQIVRREGLNVAVEALDVTSDDQITRTVATIIASDGRVDVLVNNAGVPGVAAAIEELDESVARTTFETNFWGPFRLSRAVLPHMRRQGQGVIVNVSSFAARFPGSGVLAIYGLTKHLVSRLSESLQDELTSTGVRVVAIEPGFFATEIYDSAKRGTIDPMSPYAAMVAATDAAIADGIAAGADPSIVAAAIVTAVDDPSSPTCVLVGDDAVAAVEEFRQAEYGSWRSATSPVGASDAHVKHH
ncbi:MAG TPA: SDR family NAD(P)-dependent oxidoreductase [Ilumatobacter sp.]|jgi:NAD(P)-dependent dehydrogenase (short-subunit alcohol dehydrogenase family)|nr:SDR family NAD(P)-dependent oxidoreductase [Ilumatobacter sp.]